MSLAAIREQNKLKNCIIYAKKENNISPEVANKIKKDVYDGFIEPLGHKSFAKYCEKH